MKEENKFFSKAKTRARAILKDKPRVKHVLDKAAQKLNSGNKGEEPSNVWSKTKVLIRLVKSYMNGSYRNIPRNSLLKLTAAIVYFVMPADLIPDIIPVTGFVDDITIILWVWNSLQKDIEDFLHWEKKQPASSS